MCNSNTVQSTLIAQAVTVTPHQSRMFETPGERISRRGLGHTSSPLHTGPPVRYALMAETLTGSYDVYGDASVSVEYSWRVSLINSEICMCTDYSKPLLGQITLGWPTVSGATSSSASGGHRCVVCKMLRPYRITSLSTL